MSKIQILDSNLANMIAAGEVVERPSSVIKELVENSIDAHARRVTVSLKDAGRTSIYVEDDGDGMDKEDALLAFKRHATSKIHSSFDLFRIKTLGFRGEALPSIASVSRLTLITSSGEGVGTKVVLEGENVQVENAPLRKGTQIEVEELFYNTPARLKYLKKDYTENANSIEVMTRIALAHPEISFRFLIDDREQFFTSGRGNLLETIAQIYGYEVAKHMIPFTFEHVDFKVEGYLGEPELAKSSRYYMITLLNGRNVYMPKVQNAIQDAYHDFIPPTRFPFVVLSLTIDCALVDVNVHPSKREVRFSKEEELRVALLDAIPQALRNKGKFHDAVISPSILPKEPVMKEEKKAEQLSFFQENDQKEEVKEEIQNPMSSIIEPSYFLQEEIKEEKKDEPVSYQEEDTSDAPKQSFSISTQEKEEKKERLHLKALAQMHRTYIIAEDDEGGFYLIDQHAAYERINYEKFQRLLNENLQVHEPLVPQIIQLSLSDATLFTEAKQASLEALGLRFEPFGMQTWKVVQVPSWLDEADEKMYIDELIEQALHGDKIDVHKLRTHAIATMSCKASIRANDYLNVAEMQYVLDTLFTCENPTCCPHGRPTMIHFNQYQLEKLFKRTGV